MVVAAASPRSGPGGVGHELVGRQAAEELAAQADGHPGVAAGDAGIDEVGRAPDDPVAAIADPVEGPPVVRTGAIGPEGVGGLVGNDVGAAGDDVVRNPPAGPQRRGAGRDVVIAVVGPRADVGVVGDQDVVEGAGRAVRPELAALVVGEVQRLDKVAVPRRAQVGQRKVRAPGPDVDDRPRSGRKPLHIVVDPQPEHRRGLVAVVLGIADVVRADDEVAVEIAAADLHRRAGPDEAASRNDRLVPTVARRARREGGRHRVVEVPDEADAVGDRDGGVEAGDGPAPHHQFGDRLDEGGAVGSGVDRRVAGAGGGGGELEAALHPHALGALLVGGVRAPHHAAGRGVRIEVDVLPLRSLVQRLQIAAEAGMRPGLQVDLAAADIIMRRAAACGVVDGLGGGQGREDRRVAVGERALCRVRRGIARIDASGAARGARRVHERIALLVDVRRVAEEVMPRLRVAAVLDGPVVPEVVPDAGSVRDPCGGPGRPARRGRGSRRGQDVQIGAVADHHIGGRVVGIALPVGALADDPAAEGLSDPGVDRPFLEGVAVGDARGIDRGRIDLEGLAARRAGGDLGRQGRRADGHDRRGLAAGGVPGLGLDAGDRRAVLAPGVLDQHFGGQAAGRALVGRTEHPHDGDLDRQGRIVRRRRRARHGAQAADRVGPLVDHHLVDGRDTDVDRAVERRILDHVRARDGLEIAGRDRRAGADADEGPGDATHHLGAGGVGREGPGLRAAGQGEVEVAAVGAEATGGDGPRCDGRRPGLAKRQRTLDGAIIGGRVAGGVEAGVVDVDRQLGGVEAADRHEVAAHHRPVGLGRHVLERDGRHPAVGRDGIAAGRERRTLDGREEPGDRGAKGRGLQGGEGAGMARPNEPGRSAKKESSAAHGQLTRVSRTTLMVLPPWGVIAPPATSRP